MSLTVTEIQRRTLAILEARVDQIALLPSIVTELSAVDPDSPGAADKIESLACSDPPLALRLLRLANADTENQGSIATIREAITYLGLRRLTELIVALKVVKVFVANTQNQRNLWVHSIQTALGARRLAELRPDRNLGAEEAFLAGLLHDIGRFMIFERRPQEMAQISEADIDDPRDLIEMEVRLCGFDHATLGHIICERLHLPFSVSEMVRTHHYYREQRRRIPPEVENLVRIIQEADFLSFGLMRHRSQLLHYKAARKEWIDQSIRLIPEYDAELSLEQWGSDLQRIDDDARTAAALIDIAYSED